MVVDLDDGGEDEDIVVVTELRSDRIKSEKEVKILKVWVFICHLNWLELLTIIIKICNIYNLYLAPTQICSKCFTIVLCYLLFCFWSCDSCWTIIWFIRSVLLMSWRKRKDWNIVLDKGNELWYFQLCIIFIKKNNNPAIQNL